MIRGSFLGLEYLRTDKGGRGGVIVNVSSVAGKSNVLIICKINIYFASNRFLDVLCFMSISK